MTEDLNRCKEKIDEVLKMEKQPIFLASTSIVPIIEESTDYTDGRDSVKQP